MATSSSATATVDSAQPASGQAVPERSLPEQSGWRAEVLAPISEEAPCGTDATYDDDFRLVKEKIDALNSFSGRIDQEKALSDEDASFVQEAEQGEEVFATIETVSRRILREKSKDVRIVCYLGLALAQQRGLAGAAEGLAVVRALVEEYWEEMYPPMHRMRARQGAFTFLFQRLRVLLDAAEPGAEDHALLQGALGDIEALQAVLMERMEDQAPITSSLKKKLEALLRQVPDPAESEASVSSEVEKRTVEEPGGGAPNVEEAGSGEVSAGKATEVSQQTGEQKDAAAQSRAERQNGGTGETGGGEALPERAAGRHGDGAPHDVALAKAEESPTEALSAKQVTRRLLEGVTAMREQDDTQAVPYRIARSLRWDALRVLPTHDEDDGRTRVAPPPEQRCTYLRGLPEKERYRRLISDAEDSFHQSPFHFWLDLQRLVVQGLDALGKPYEAAALAVRRECALLLERLPGLPRLRFRDGTPFASPATRAWLETSVQAVLNSREGAVEDGAYETPSSADPLDEQFQEARRRLGEGDLAAALQLMKGSDTSRAGPSGREQFRRRLYSALLCMRAGQHAVARPVLEALGAEADRRELSDWNPPLALEVWSGLCECLMVLASERPSEDSPQFSPPGRDDGAPARETGDGGDFRKRAACAFARVCELDPSRAFRLRRKLPGNQ